MKKKAIGMLVSLAAVSFSAVSNAEPQKAAAASQQETDVGKYQAETLFNSFVQGCISTGMNEGKIDAAMAKNEAAPDVMTRAFLEGDKGKGWMIRGNHGAYALAVPSNYSFCKAFAKDAVEGDVHSQFQKLTEQPVEGYKATKIGEDTKSEPGKGIRKAGFVLAGEEKRFLVEVETRTDGRSMFKASAGMKEISKEEAERLMKLRVGARR